MYTDSEVRLISGRVSCDEIGPILFIRCGASPPLVRGLEHHDTYGCRLILSFYAEPNFEVPQGAIVICGGSSKLDAFKKAYNSGYIPSGAQCYAIFDPDVDVDIRDISRVFGFMRRFSEAAICQPALTKDSHVSWGFLRRKRMSIFRRTNFCEVMCPFFNHQALASCISTFDLSMSTWGIDMLWHRLVPFGRMYIFDGVSVRHSSPVDTTNWAFYQYLATKGVDPWQEMAGIISDHGLAGFRPRVIGLVEYFSFVLLRVFRSAL